MRLALLVALGPILVSGCAAAGVLTPPVHTALSVPAGRTLIVGPLVAHTTPPIALQTRYGSVATSSGFTPDRVRAVDRELRRLLTDAHLAVEDERDLGAGAPGPGTYLLRLEVLAYRDDVSYAFADVIGCAVAGGLTLGLGALPCISTRNGATQTVEVEARLYAADGARAASVPVNGHLEASVDVTDRRPVWHGTARVHLAVGYNLAGVTNPTFEEEEDTRLAQLIFAQLAPALAHGLAEPITPDALGRPASPLPTAAPAPVANAAAI